MSAKNEGRRRPPARQNFPKSDWLIYLLRQFSKGCNNLAV